MTDFNISVPHDSGNIEILDQSDPMAVRLNIAKDGNADFHQWFYFRATGAGGQACRFAIENAGTSSYVDGWTDYGVCASYDMETWFRIDTSYTNGVLSWTHMPQRNSVYYAYFAPYPIERYRQYIGELMEAYLAHHQPLGLTCDGEPLDLFQIGNREAPLTLWVIGRQHPGETMGSFWMEGFINRLLDPDDAAATALRQRANLYVVPLVNIDGSHRGHLRTNAAGADLNREWQEPTAERSPEVLAIRNKMDEVGCDLFLDVHGDEAIANNFIAGGEGVPKWSPTHQARLDHFKSTLMALSPAFQIAEGYPVDAPGTANLKIATNQIAERFDCLSMTLEMPFKDAAILPDREYGWSPERCRDLGRSCLDAILAALPGLRP